MKCIDAIDPELRNGHEATLGGGAIKKEILVKLDHLNKYVAVQMEFNWFEVRALLWLLRKLDTLTRHYDERMAKSPRAQR